MKRLLLVLICGLTLAAGVWAQEGEHASAKEGEHATQEHEEGEKYLGWKWANFAILAVVLGYMMSKALPPFFQSRTAEIQKGITEAAALKADAEKRAADMERRLASMHVEIEQIRSEVRAAMAKEGERIRVDTEQHMARVQAQGEQEVAALVKHATLQLKAHSAQLALKLAEERIRSRMTAESQGALVNQFVSRMEQQGARL